MSRLELPPWADDIPPPGDGDRRPAVDVDDVQPRPSGGPDLDAVAAELDADPAVREAVEMARAPAPAEPRIAAQDGAGWPALRPLTERRPRPEVPLDGLPSDMRDMVSAVAAAVEVPPELPLCYALGCASALILGRRSYTPRADWLEQAGVYAIVALPSGERKSAACRLMREPLRAIERREVEAARARVDEARAEAALLDARARKLEAAGARQETRTERAEAAQEIAELRAELREVRAAARLPRLLLDDTSPEAALRELAEGPRAVIEPEPGLLGLTAHGYGDRPPSLEWILRAWGGEPIREHRIGREGVDVERPLMAVAVASQPAAALAYMTDPRLDDRGLPARCMVWAPEPRVGTREHRGLTIPRSVAEAWAGLLERLHGLEPQPEPIGLTPEAQAVLHDFELDLEPHLAPGGRYGHTASHGSKAPGIAVRIAGLVSGCSPWTPADPIGAEAMATGIRVVRAALEHRLAMLAEAGASPELRLAGRALAWLRQRVDGAGEVRERDLRRALRAEPRDMLDDALAELEARGYVRRVSRQTGGRPSVHLLLRPAEVRS